MNQVSRALGWLRDALILTGVELPQSLDTSGGVKPVVDITQGGEAFARYFLVEETPLVFGAGITGASRNPLLKLNAAINAEKNTQCILVAVSAEFGGGGTDPQIGLVFYDPLANNGGGNVQVPVTPYVQIPIFQASKALWQADKRFIVPPGFNVGWTVPSGGTAFGGIVTLRSIAAVIPAGLHAF